MQVVKPNLQNWLTSDENNNVQYFGCLANLEFPIESDVFTKKFIISETSQTLVIQCVTLAKFLKIYKNLISYEVYRSW